MDVGLDLAGRGAVGHLPLWPDWGLDSALGSKNKYKQNRYCNDFYLPFIVCSLDVLPLDFKDSTSSLSSWGGITLGASVICAV